MAGGAGGSAAPSYNQAVMEGGRKAGGKHLKIPMEKTAEIRGKEIVGRKGIPNQKEKQQDSSLERENGGSSKKRPQMNTIGACKPK